ncbi:hypothetical protein MTO96_022442 [Rhipicephalus appendiculatus]
MQKGATATSVDHAGDKVQKPKKNRQVAKQIASKQILEEMTVETTSDLRKELAGLKEENRKLRSFNMKLQEELLHHLSEARIRAEQTTSCSCGKEQEKSPPGTRSEATWSPLHGDHTDAPYSEQVPQSRLPVSRQLYKELDPAAFPDQLHAEAEPAETEPAKTKPPQHSRPQPPLAERVPAAAVRAPSTPVFSAMENGMVHLANSVTVSKEVYEMLMAMPKESHFVKRAATAIWSSEVLAKRSFSGALSNRFLTDGSDKAPQKPLTPRKVDALKAFFRHYAEARGLSVEETNKSAKNIRLWLSQKTCELRRKMPAAK